MPIIVVDATAFYRTLLGGAARRVFFESPDDTEFLTTSYTMEEVVGKLEEIAEKTGSTEEELLTILAVLPITILGEDEYSTTLERAQNDIGDRDPKDAPLLALFYAISGDRIWTDDKDFDDVPEAHTSTTAEMLRHAETTATGSIDMFEDIPDG